MGKPKMYFFTEYSTYIYFVSPELRKNYIYSLLFQYYRQISLQIHPVSKIIFLVLIYSSFQVSVLPPLASIFVTSIAAQLADYLISSGVETTVVCKSWSSDIIKNLNYRIPFKNWKPVTFTMFILECFYLHLFLSLPFWLKVKEEDEGRSGSSLFKGGRASYRNNGCKYKHS